MNFNYNVPMKNTTDEKTVDSNKKMAECKMCDNTEPSNEKLPFFECTAEKDTYYCGCIGWD